MVWSDMTQDFEPPHRRKADEFLEYRFNQMDKRLDELKGDKASKEATANMMESIKELRAEVHGLRRVLIVTALTWAIGTGTFLLAVLQLKGGPGP
jgi:hypothetical protein